MKRLLSVVLAFCLIFSTSYVAFAFDTEPTVTCDDPIIYIGGDSNDIYYDNDT